MQYKFKDSPTSWKIWMIVWSIVTLSAFLEPAPLGEQIFIFIIAGMMPLAMIFKPNWTFACSLAWAGLTAFGLMIMIYDGSIADDPYNFMSLIIYLFLYYLKTNEAVLMYVNRGLSKDNSFSTKPAMNEQQDNNLSGFKVVRKTKDK